MCNSPRESDEGGAMDEEDYNVKTIRTAEVVSWILCGVLVLILLYTFSALGRQGDQIRVLEAKIERTKIEQQIEDCRGDISNYNMQMLIHCVNR